MGGSNPLQFKGDADYVTVHHYKDTLNRSVHTDKDRRVTFCNRNYIFKLRFKIACPGNVIEVSCIF